MITRRTRFPDTSVLVNFIYPIGLVLLNLVLKILFLDNRDVSMDEPFTIFYAQVDFRTLFEMLRTENNPPLFFIILHFWIKVFGISAFSVRFMAMVFSTLTVLVIYLIGKRFFSFRIGLLASLIFTFSNYHLLFAHEARVYSLFALLTSVSMFLFLQLSIRQSLRTIIFLAVTNLMLLYSHFFGFYIIFIQLTSCFLIKELRNRVLKQYFIIIVMVIVLYIPYLSMFISRFWLSSSHGTWVPKPIISDLYNMVWRFSNAPVTTVCFLITLFTAFIIYLTRYKKDRESCQTTSAIILIWFFLPYIFMFLISFKIPMFLDRYMVFISLGYYLLIAMSVSYLGKKRWVYCILSIIVISLMVVTFTPHEDNKRKVKEVVQTINKLKTNESVIVICPEWLNLGFVYYYNQEYFKDYKNLKKNLNKEGIFSINNINQIDTSLFAGASNVIYLEEWASLVDKENQILKHLRSRFGTRRQYKGYEPFTVYHFCR
jgi:mannosyltransferase